MTDSTSDRPGEPGHRPAEPGHRPTEPGHRPGEPGHRPGEPGHRPAGTERRRRPERQADWWMSDPRRLSTVDEDDRPAPTRLLDTGLDRPTARRAFAPTWRRTVRLDTDASPRRLLPRAGSAAVSESEADGGESESTVDDGTPSPQRSGGGRFRLHLVHGGRSERARGDRRRGGRGRTTGVPDDDATEVLDATDILAAIEAGCAANGAGTGPRPPAAGVDEATVAVPRDASPNGTMDASTETGTSAGTNGRPAGVPGAQRAEAAAVAVSGAVRDSTDGVDDATVILPVGPTLGRNADSATRTPRATPPPVRREHARGAPVRLVQRRQLPERRAAQRRLPPGWPLTALLVGFPLWWALGLSSFVFPLISIPMAVMLVRRRPIRLPRGFVLWALFLVWLVVSLVMLPFDPTYTIAGTWSGRLISIGVTLVEYVGVTITLLYVGNLTEREMPRQRVVRMLGVLFLTTVGGGLLGVLAPKFGFTSPVEMLLPHSLRADPYIQALVHPTSSQVQAVLGYSSGRPAAPFGYTNFWGANYSILLLWFVAGWWARRSSSRRVVCAAVIAVSLVPVIYSLNRALWLGLVVTVVYLAARLVLSGRGWAVGAIGAVAVVGALFFMTSPLRTIVQERLAHPHSNDIRGLLSAEAVRGAKESPILGWGGTRKIVGSDKSITVGKTAKCPFCGNFAIGSNGQLWAVLFNQGFLGAFFFFGFFAYCVWFYRRDGTPVGQAGVFAVALTFLYMFFYNSLPSSLTLVMISIALLWRASDARRAETDGERAPAQPRERVLTGGSAR